MTRPCFPRVPVSEFCRIAVLGPGVLGGSIALALQERHPLRSVMLWGRNPERTEKIRNSCWRDITDSLSEAVAGADLIILAVPVECLEDLGREILNIGIQSTVCVTDVGSVKAGPHQTLGQLMDSKGVTFIGSHPMAGSERTGFGAADANLFSGASCILTNEHRHPEEAVTRLASFWEELGASTSVMDAQEHDRLVGRISHLPHVLSTICALTALQKVEDGQFSGQGLRDTSRVAAGDPSMWAEILLQNRSQIINPIREAASELSKMAEHLSQKDRAAILAALKEGQRKRKTLDLEE